ncbi:hypothetical protein [Burkholderia plantarii]|uniref:hypothetical protein n=1 Tax=Burkholderia plantarii TaxID=41899 RepID=UPI0018DBBEC1|nr:hypothetical protein [Burkholderia plantarii]MBI0325694.1 hypothetical protein [Burkholderia plantarii]
MGDSRLSHRCDACTPPARAAPTGDEPDGDHPNRISDVRREGTRRQQPVRRGFRTRANRPGVDSATFEPRDTAEPTAGADFMGAQGWRDARRAEHDRDGVNCDRGFDAPCGGRFECAIRPGDGRGVARCRELSARRTGRASTGRGTDASPRLS